MWIYGKNNGDALNQDLKVIAIYILHPLPLASEKPSFLLELMTSFTGDQSSVLPSSSSRAEKVPITSMPKSHARMKLNCHWGRKDLIWTHCAPCEPTWWANMMSWQYGSACRSVHLWHSLTVTTSRIHCWQQGDALSSSSIWFLLKLQQFHWEKNI